MRLIFLASLFLAPLLGRSDEAPQTDRVKIIVVNSFGGEVRELSTLRFTAQGISQTVSVQGRATIHLAPGNYTVECSAPSYTKQYRVVQVRDPEVLVVFGLAMKSPDQLIGEGPIIPWVVSGQLSPAKKGLVIVRVEGIFSGSSCEAEPDEKGLFSLPIFDQGKYRLMVLTPPGLAFEKELDLDISIPKAVKLGTIPLK